MAMNMRTFVMVEGGLLGLLILIADIYAIVKTVSSRATTLAKVLWVIGILIFPVVGFLVWLLFGPSDERQDLVTRR